MIAVVLVIVALLILAGLRVIIRESNENLDRKMARAVRRDPDHDWHVTADRERMQP